MAVSRVVVVEDSEAIRASVCAALTAQGLEVVGLPDGTELEAVLAGPRIDVIILDLMLPGRDGLELLEVVRRVSTAAVLIVTARDSTADRVTGLMQGADDYLVKPFAMSELLARIQAILRRTRPDAGAIVVGDLEISADGSTVRRGQCVIDLTQTERQVLDYLAAHRDQVVSKLQILTGVWGYDGFDPNVVEVHVSTLRRKLEADDRPRLLHTVRGRGYRLSGTS
ncbi:response regulator transcription factor [Microlunatus endophyticus]|uniref:response regulator transcription factor n=1 Tax=Microlunatus endophyticus TaxID=1716077 RepID=UPI001E6255C0|nr:response regulator transcription factor [Microlunatus endophyticus]